MLNEGRDQVREKKSYILPNVRGSRPLFTGFQRGHCNFLVQDVCDLVLTI